MAPASGMTCLNAGRFLRAELDAGPWIYIPIDRPLTRPSSGYAIVRTVKPSDALTRENRWRRRLPEIRLLYTALRVALSAWIAVLCIAVGLWAARLRLTAFQRVSVWIALSLATVAVNVLVWWRL